MALQRLGLVGTRRTQEALTQCRRIDPPEVDAAAVALPSQGIGPLPIRLRKNATGHHQGLISVPVLGDWKLTITTRTSPIHEFTSALGLPIN